MMDQATELKIKQLETVLADAELVVSHVHDLIIGLARYHTRLKDLSAELMAASEEAENDSREAENFRKRAERHLDQASAIRWLVKSSPELIQHVFGEELQIEDIATSKAVDEDCALLDKIAMMKYVHATRLVIIDNLAGIGKLGVKTQAFKEKQFAKRQY